MTRGGERAAATGRVAPLLALLGLAASLTSLVAHASRPEPGPVRNDEGTVGAAGLRARVDALTADWAALRSTALPFEARPRPPVLGRDSSARDARLLDLERRVARWREVAALRCVLLAGGGGGLVDDVFSASVYRERIRDPGTSLPERAEAFGRITPLGASDTYLVDLAPQWVHCVLEATDEGDLAWLVLASHALPRDDVVRSLLLEEARYSPFENVRRNALGGLSRQGGEEAWRAIRSALDDPSPAVVREATALLCRGGGDD